MINENDRRIAFWNRKKEKIILRDLKWSIRFKSGNYIITHSHTNQMFVFIKGMVQNDGGGVAY